MASLPFVDVLYIRCEWRDVQNGPGKLDLNPVWKLTFDAAKARQARGVSGDALQYRIPAEKAGDARLPDGESARSGHRKSARSGGRSGYREPRYDHPEFLRAFRELNELLAAEFDGHPQVEFADLMMYGFWGEAHTSDLPSPFPDYLTAERTMTGIARLQLEAGKRRRSPSIRNRTSAAWETAKCRICACGKGVGCGRIRSSTLRNRCKSRCWPIARPGWPR